MKLPGINYGTAVQSLGREDVRGPVRVAQAQLGAVKQQASAAQAWASTAQKRASVAGQVAGDMAAIGGIHQRSAREVDQYYAREGQRTAEFSRNMLALADQGMDLTVSIIKTEATETAKKWKEAVDATYQGMTQDDNRTMTMPVDPNDPSMGTKEVSIAGELAPTFQEFLQNSKESFLKDANPWARGMLEDMMDEYSAEASLKMQQTANNWAKDDNYYKSLDIVEDYLEQGTAGIAQAKAYMSENPDAFNTPARTADAKNRIDAAEREYEIDGKMRDAYAGVEHLPYAEQQKELMQIPDKDVRQSALAMSDRMENIRREAKNEAKKQRIERAEKSWLEQIRLVDEVEM